MADPGALASSGADYVCFSGTLNTMDEETARALGVSPRTIKEDWRMARVWLQRELT